MSRIIAAACTAAALLLSSSAFAQDVAAGETVFKKCAACHNVDSDKNKIGPSLQGVIGRQPGIVEGFKYSKAMTDFGAGKVWDDAQLTAYLANPRGVVKGTRMAFVGLKDPKEVTDVIAYLKTFSTAQ
ncbi:c-type cytochrome [Rhizobium rhizophilum]|uniref:Cytochrome c family protein n=1 Tax=Rhizobium rhizophilum TaxID=1850373 RepID=A0ABY2QVN5_9HYPH|nr:cytochrome c family protein [Rhizobium rhizophilum]MBX9468747.1 cytochrome c family protein [Rhizobium sp.]THV14998.1 cytochrome c family protein [Rhizobium rhizophilum]